MNWGLYDELKEAFPETIAVNKEEIINNHNILTSAKEWVAGFSTGESYFFTTIQKYKTKSGIATSLPFFYSSRFEKFIGKWKFCILFFWMWVCG